MNVYQILTDSARKFAQKPAIIFKDKVINFIELKNSVMALARGLQEAGADHGKKIALYLPNCPEYVYSYLSSFLVGAVVIPLDYMLKRDELTACLSHSEADFVIALPKSEIDWNLIQKELPSLKKIITLGPDFERLFMPGEFKEVTIAEADPALIMYTSGTTGSPKGILLNYKHLQGSPQAMKYFVDLSERDVKLCAIPLAHIGGFIYIQNCIIFGITLVLMDRFHPMEFLKNVAQYKVTCFHIVPPMYTAVLTVKNIDQFDLSSLRWVVVFGAPNSPDILERFHKYCPNAKLLNGWGMTETCPPNTVTPLDLNGLLNGPGPLSSRDQVRSVSSSANLTPTKKYKLFSKDQIAEIVRLVNGDAQMQELGSKTAMNMDLAVCLQETGDIYSFKFENGRIVKTGQDAEAEFLITANESIWRAVFNREIDPFVATTQKKMNLRGDFARISKWYAPCSRIFQLWTQVPVE